MNNLDIIRAACIKANPEIASDTRGYKQEQLDEAYREYLAICKQVADEDAPQSRTWALPALAFERVKNLSAALVIFQDRPVRLADVLLAIGEKAEGPVDYAIDAYGRFRKRENDGLFNWVKIPDGLTIVVWNLRLDDVSLQSEPTKAFLAELLK